MIDEIILSHQMIIPNQIPEPFLFNQLKHHLTFIRYYIEANATVDGSKDVAEIVRNLRHLGTAVMDIYKGSLAPQEISMEISTMLKTNGFYDRNKFAVWTGTNFSDFRIVTLSDGSGWTLKFHNSESRYIHLFPARNDPYSLRVKANTLKTAVLYLILTGKDFINTRELNNARKLMGLSPLKDTEEAKAITEMIEILRI